MEKMIGRFQSCSYCGGKGFVDESPKIRHTCVFCNGVGGDYPGMKQALRIIENLERNLEELRISIRGSLDEKLRP